MNVRINSKRVMLVLLLLWFVHFGGGGMISDLLKLFWIEFMHFGIIEQ